MTTPKPATLLAELEALLKESGAAAALACCKERIKIAADDADAHRFLGQLYAYGGEPQLGAQAAERACELAPNDPNCFSDLARVYALQGQFARAARSCEQALELDPLHADAWHNLGAALKQLGDIENAFAAYRKCLSIAPERAQTYLNLGNLLLEMAQFDDAITCFERAAQYNPHLASVRSRLAAELSSRGNVNRAELMYRQSLGLDPEQVEAWFGLGRTLEDLGEAEGALSCYLNVLERQPGHASALCQYLSLIRGEPLEIFSTAENTIQDAQVSDEQKALIAYGLLHYHDRRKQFDRAASAGRIANAARRNKAGALDRNRLAERVDSIVQTLSGAFFDERRSWGSSSEQPVFIVGLPRSGTTLTEQILAAHPMMHGAGELPDLVRIASRHVRADEDTWRAALALEAASSVECSEGYLHALREHAPTSARRISDKTPLNFFHLAFAAVLFPRARIIHCQRDPRDNALSIWMANFNNDQRYATDFDDLAFYHAQYRRLMAHWETHLPLPIMTVKYEDTVAGLEQQARNLTAFLDIPWDPRCLEFHTNSRSVQTPSRWQVREPIYSHSVARWQKYAPWLPELSAAFRQ